MKQSSKVCLKPSDELRMAVANDVGFAEIGSIVVREISDDGLPFLFLDERDAKLFILMLVEALIRLPREDSSDE